MAIGNTFNSFAPNYQGSYNNPMGGANFGGAAVAGVGVGVLVGGPLNGNFGGGDMNMANFGAGPESMDSGFMSLLGALLEEYAAESEMGGPEGSAEQPPVEGSSVEQRGGRGADTQDINGSAGDDTTLQRGRKGNDFQTADGSDGNDFITQRGGRGLNTQRAQGGKGDDVIHQRGVGKNTSLAEGGEGNDQFIYDLNGKRANATLKGGEGFDSATINADKKNVTVIGANGEVLFKKGNGGSTIRVDSVEDLKVMGKNGKMLYDSMAEEQGATGGTGGGTGGPGGPGRPGGGPGRPGRPGGHDGGAHGHGHYHGRQTNAGY